ncbi:hypothetical protein BXY64_4259 [Marinifilum flexuosum]|uniref:Uncharacterized protein n=1 Tax=Marinifilum flexuosum TaxID=1117708 RepID=A0A419WFH3_9BACT|nr:hypothetical protein BXY64_4259 [Marinifilum flexuosum]
MVKDIQRIIENLLIIFYNLGNEVVVLAGTGRGR